MVYDDETGRRVHLSLPLEQLKEMADRMVHPPTQEATRQIVQAVKERARGPNRPKVSPSRIRSDLRHARIDVTVEQVAWVMLTAMRPPEVAPPPRKRARRRRSRILRWLPGQRARHDS